MRTAALLMLLTACGEVGHFRPVNFTPTEVSIISNAFNAWCEASNGTKCAVVDKDSNTTIILSNNLQSERWGEYDAPHSRIVVRNGREYSDWPKILLGIMLHETGHHFFCTEENPAFTEPSAMGRLSQAIDANGVVDLEGLRTRDVCPEW